MAKNQMADNPWGEHDHLIHERSYEPGEELYGQGEDFAGIYYIASGLVGLRKVDENGATTLVGLLGAGDIAGYAPLLIQSEHLTSADVLQPSGISFICAKTVRSIARDVPAFLPMLFGQATRDLSRLEDRYMQISTQQAHTRLASLLLTLRTHAGCSVSARASTFHLPVLHKDMADLIGIRPETLSRAIAQLRSAGLAEFHGHTVHVPSLAALRGMAKSEIRRHRIFG